MGGTVGMIGKDARQCKYPREKRGSTPRHLQMYWKRQILRMICYVCQIQARRIIRGAVLAQVSLYTESLLCIGFAHT